MNAPAKPSPLRPQFGTIPPALRAMNSWLVWRYEWRNDKAGGGKWTKPPHSVRGGYAKTNQPATWATFDVAREAAVRADGLGLVLTDDLVGIDLDHVADSAGALEPWAADVLRRFAQCYAERSPGGDGLRIFCRGKARHCGKGGPGNRLEVYDKTSPRYLTVTGHRLGEGEVIRAQAALDWLQEHHMRKVPPPGGGSNGVAGAVGAARSDDQVLGLAGKAQNGPKFAQLFAGIGGDDASSNDAALVGMLSFWTQDVAQIDRLFRRSGLMRDKWDTKRGKTTYGALTIEDILAGGGAHFGAGGKAAAKATKATKATKVSVEYGETSMSRTFALHNAERFRFVPEWGQWLFWDGTRWRPDVEGSSRLAAKVLCDEFSALARNDRMFGTAGACERAALRCQAKKTVDAVLDLATVEPALVVLSRQLDANEWLLNTPTGTVNLLDGQTREHRRDDFITKATSVAPAAGARPTFERFLREVTCGDAALADYLQTALGACLSGAVSDHWLMFWFGPGRNGKNTLGDLVAEILGDYAKKVAVQTLMADDRGSRHPTEIANLRGLRLAVSSEIGEGEHWDESRVKELSGDDMLSARLMRQDFFEFRRTHKHLVYGNHRPMLRIVDPAMAARLHIVPFDATFSEELGNLDPAMPSKLRAEAPAILSWLIDGHMKWREDGTLKRCERVASSTREYLDSQSTLDQWVADRCTLVPDDGRAGREWQKAGELYLDFAAWKKDRGERPLSQTRWGEWMERRYRRVKADGNRYAGVYLRSRLAP